MKEWKEIKFYPDYEINIDGEVRNKKKNYVLIKSTDKYGFFYYTLKKNNQNKIVRLGKLILQNFCEELDEETFKVSIVGRKDGNKKNDNINNLYWIKKQPKKIQQKTEVNNSIKEVWKTIPFNQNYEVSNLGRIKTKSNGLIREGGLNKSGYSTINLSENKKQKHYLIHRIVMMTFYPIDNSDLFQVDHINGINTDNTLDNLRWVLNIENQQKRKDNRNPIGSKIATLIKKYGYENVYEEIMKLENNLKEK